MLQFPLEIKIKRRNVKKVVFIALTVLTIVIALPLLSIAGGGQNMNGRPDGDMPFKGADDRTNGSWGYLSGEDEPPGNHVGGDYYQG